MHVSSNILCLHSCISNMGQTHLKEYIVRYKWIVVVDDYFKHIRWSVVTFDFPGCYDTESD